MNVLAIHTRKITRLVFAAALFSIAAPVLSQPIIPRPVFIFSPSLTLTPPSQTSIGFSPLTGIVGLTQYVFINGCTSLGAIFFPTAFVANTLTLQTVGVQSPCSFPITNLPIKFGSIGVGRVILNSSSGVLADKTIQVVAPVAATVNIDGLWYDETTDGSGISFFQSPQTGQVFGAWFLYASAPVASEQTAATPRWYSLQNTAWTNNGNVLEGTIFDSKADANGSSACGAGTDCPRRLNTVSPVGSFRFVLSDANTGRIETFDTTGTRVFASNLQRIQF